MRASRIIIASLLLTLISSTLLFAQINIIYKDSIVHRIIYKDSIIYKHDTVVIKHYVHSDTAFETPKIAASSIPIPNVSRKRLLNPNNWGIGPSVGFYYSPFHGGDINIGFGIQYYILAIPTFKNPHMGRHNKRRR